MRNPTRTASPDTISLSLIALLVLLAVSAACGGGGGSSPSEASVQQGQIIYSRLCATCHGKDANGLPRLGKGLHDNEFTKSQSDAELVEFLKNGRPATHPLNTTGVDMPPKGGDLSITDEDLQNVVAFLRTL